MHLRLSASSKQLENLQFCGKIYCLAFLAERSSKAPSWSSLSLMLDVMIQSLLRIGQCKYLPWGLEQPMEDSRTLEQQQPKKLCLAFSKIKELKTNKNLQWSAIHEGIASSARWMAPLPGAGQSGSGRTVATLAEKVKWSLSNINCYINCFHQGLHPHSWEILKKEMLRVEGPILLLLRTGKRTWIPLCNLIGEGQGGSQLWRHQSISWWLGGLKNIVIVSWGKSKALLWPWNLGHVLYLHVCCLISGLSAQNPLEYCNNDYFFPKCMRVIKWVFLAIFSDTLGHAEVTSQASSHNHKSVFKQRRQNHLCPEALVHSPHFQ